MAKSAFKAMWTLELLHRNQLGYLLKCRLLNSIHSGFTEEESLKMKLRSLYFSQAPQVIWIYFKVWEPLVWLKSYKILPCLEDGGNGYNHSWTWGSQGMLRQNVHLSSAQKLNSKGFGVIWVLWLEIIYNQPSPAECCCFLNCKMKELL